MHDRPRTDLIDFSDADMYRSSAAAVEPFVERMTLWWRRVWSQCTQTDH